MIHTVLDMIWMQTNSSRNSSIEYREVTDVILLYIKWGLPMLFGRYRVVVHVAPSRKQEFPIGVITPTPSIETIQRRKPK